MAELTTGSLRGDAKPPTIDAAATAAIINDTQSVQPPPAGPIGVEPTALRKPAQTTSTPSPKGARASKTRGSSGRSPFDERAMTGGGFFLSGAWSKAGVCSCFNVRHPHLLGKHGVVFDMGVCPSEVEECFFQFTGVPGVIVAELRARELDRGGSDRIGIEVDKRFARKSEVADAADHHPSGTSPTQTSTLPKANDVVHMHRAAPRGSNTTPPFPAPPPPPFSRQFWRFCLLRLCLLL